MLDLSLTSPRTPTMRSTMPFSPKPGTGRPVSGSSAARKNPGVTVNNRSLPAPSVQYAGPRPEVLRGARAKRCSPSFGRQCHSSSPLFGSIATTLRVVPACV